MEVAPKTEICLPASLPVSIIILTHNQLEYTKLCIESVEKYTPEPYQLILVDNGSADGTVEYLEAVVAHHFSHRLICNRENLGFAKGCNQGIEEASGDYVLLLNNDTVVTEGYIEAMIECAKSDARIGIVGPMTNFISGPQRVRKADYSSLSKMQDYARAFSYKNRGNWFDLPRITGFAMLIKREALEEVGKFDERFGIGCSEDDDFCFRVYLTGYRAVVCGDCFIHHFGSKTLNNMGIDYHELLRNNMGIFLDKWKDHRRSLWKFLLRHAGGRLLLKLPGSFLRPKNSRRF